MFYKKRTKNKKTKKKKKKKKTKKKKKKPQKTKKKTKTVETRRHSITRNYVISFRINLETEQNNQRLCFEIFPVHWFFDKTVI